MTSRSHDAGDIEITCKVGLLRVSIVGPADQATDLLRDISALRAGVASPGGSADFELVQGPEGVVNNSGEPLEHRHEILDTFVDCPVHLVLGGSRLTGSSTSGADRIRRAWRAGQWAKAVASGRVATPSRTPPLDLRPRFYAVLRATGLESPVVYRSARSYWACVGDLSTSTAISHGFPSELEARTFFAGAQVRDFELVA